MKPPFSRPRGARLLGADGTRSLDFSAGLEAGILGYSHPLVRALERRRSPRRQGPFARRALPTHALREVREWLGRPVFPLATGRALEWLGRHRVDGLSFESSRLPKAGSEAARSDSALLFGDTGSGSVWVSTFLGEASLPERIPADREALLWPGPWTALDLPPLWTPAGGAEAPGDVLLDEAGCAAWDFYLRRFRDERRRLLRKSTTKLLEDAWDAIAGAGRTKVARIAPHLVRLSPPADFFRDWNHPDGMDARVVREDVTFLLEGADAIVALPFEIEKDHLASRLKKLKSWFG